MTKKKNISNEENVVENSGEEIETKNAQNCEMENKVCREDEFKETLQRLQAEFENYRKRNESMIDKYKEDGIVTAISKLLPVLDSFKSAKMVVKDEEFLKSLDLIEKQFNEGLNNLKIKKIDAEGKIFDPKFHNAVMTGTDENKLDDEILDVFQDGYILNDNRVIRHSVVRINKLNG